MLASTEKLIKIFEECGLRHRVDGNFSADTDVISVRMKRPDRAYTDFAVFMADNCTEASIEAIIGKTTPKLRPVCLEILNKLTKEQKWIRYTINDENIISAQIQVVATEQTLPSLAFQLLCHAADCVAEGKRRLRESGVISI